MTWLAVMPANTLFPGRGDKERVKIMIIYSVLIKQPVDYFV